MCCTPAPLQLLISVLLAAWLLHACRELGPLELQLPHLTTEESLSCPLLPHSYSTGFNLLHMYSFPS